MYRDGGYGENWQPAAAGNARRIDPYTRSCAVLGGLFAIGFVLIIIVVLSLIPIYISHNTAQANKNIQVAKLLIPGYTLQFRSPVDQFQAETILSQSDNRLALEAALTAMLQQDAGTSGSIVDIATTKKRRKRRQLINLAFDLTVTGNRPCATTGCLHQFQSRTNNLFTNVNRTATFVRYQLTNSSANYWLTFRLPGAISSSISSTSADSTTLASTLDTLLTIDRTRNQPVLTTTPVPSTAMPTA